MDMKCGFHVIASSRAEEPVGGRGQPGPFGIPRGGQPGATGEGERDGCGYGIGVAYKRAPPIR